MAKKSNSSKDATSSKKDMRLELLKELAFAIAGKNTVPIIELLYGKNNVNEFIIAKKLDLTINQVRNVLYKLSDEGLVSFARKKDKKKGWYTYFWTFNEERGLVILRNFILKDIENLEHQLHSRTTKQFYYCTICTSEITEENALLHNFTCPECGEIYELNDNTKSIKEINSAIDKNKNKLSYIEGELSSIDDKKVKAVIRKKKKVEKEKTEKRKEAAKKRAETRKKSAETKKKVVKKSKK